MDAFSRGRTLATSQQRLTKIIIDNYRGMWVPDSYELSTNDPIIAIDSVSGYIRNDLPLHGDELGLVNAFSGWLYDKQPNVWGAFLVGCVFGALCIRERHRRARIPLPWEREELPSAVVEPQTFADIDSIEDSSIHPTMLKRDDGLCLLYPGLTHSFAGEPNSGKSLVLQYEAVNIAQTGNKVLYLDYESSRVQLASRLKKLGLTSKHGANITYVKDLQPGSPLFEQLLVERWALVVIDGVTAALSLAGGSDSPSNNNDLITKWNKSLPDKFAGEGAAVAMIDHVTKSKDGRGAFAIGGQAKMATLTGAAYVVEQSQPFAPGRDGELSIYLAKKDREGFVMGAIEGNPTRNGLTVVTRADVLSGDGGDSIEILLRVPDSLEVIAESRSNKYRRKVWEFVRDNPGSGTREIKNAGLGDTPSVLEALRDLTDEGYVSKQKVGRAVEHNVEREFIAGIDSIEELDLEEL